MLQLWHFLLFTFIVLSLLFVFTSNEVIFVGVILFGLFTFLVWLYKHLQKNQEKVLSDLRCYKCKKDDVPIRIEDAKGYVGKYWVCDTCPTQSVDETGGI